LKIAIIAPTAAALKTLTAFGIAVTAEVWIPSRLQTAAETLAATGLQVQIYSQPLRSLVASLWQSQEGLVFGLATGAVVRLVAPLLTDKTTDPAVVVVDGAGKFAISLCGGHIGGSDRLAQQVAQYLQATPVLTGAAHHRDLPGIDVLGTPFGWRRGTGDWTGVSAAIAHDQPVQVIQEAGSTLWQNHLPADHPFQFGWPEYTAEHREQRSEPQARVWISPICRQFASDSQLPKVQWHPRVLWVGIGCERGTPQALIADAIDQTCRQHHLATPAIAGVASLDLKADEPGLAALCQENRWPLRCFTAEQLQDIPVPTPSAVVEAAVGTPSVAEAAAIAATLPPHPLTSSPPHPLTPSPLIVPKHIHRHPDHPGAVTVAIAQAEQEYTGRPGALWLVGIGPGSLEQITPAVRSAINQADVVIGYSLYVDLIRPLLRSGQIIEALPITQERQRAERAIELARWGLSVVVVSSGDCGIYGMAGLVLEILQQQGWDGNAPSVQTLPGISALQAAAARVGAPLMHDFCAISLSDLLTPWEVIQTRLVAAAQADFVVALYNPKSKTRTHQIEVAQQLFLAHRPGTTPVAIVRSAFRPEEQVVLTTLEQMLEHPIDMLTTVLIGNRSTRQQGAYLVTPRGYLGRVRGEE
jgi:cobalt-precorrin 5A hydrolase/precorrin-3B C17-methyltransferase